MLRVCFVKCDVTKKEQFTNLFDKTEEFFQVSCVDLLANNAGINLNHGWRLCMEVNIMSVMLGTEIALERMRAAGKSGQIINTASMAGLAPGLSEKMLAYTVSKHGVVALTRTMGATTKVGNKERLREIDISKLILTGCGSQVYLSILGGHRDCVRSPGHSGGER